MEQSINTKIQHYLAKSVQGVYLLVDFSFYLVTILMKMRP
jgi:hypothetical protein